ncbi:MAG: M23 family metallopeptidase [Castellaniella sp.]|uniref:M23 family metallopeptidase n=1 Tax=Castellaniella sp. TaxID=1955812 RepID=UPI002A36E8D9|nr:M23 family metallopeptidase [Castellaniella sp.]MDY0308746.1 M23 family metallopeptidase [Castellaniella sp.]
MTKSKRAARAALWLHSNARLLRGLGGLCALALAAWGGAQWQAWRAPALGPGQREAIDTRLRQDSAALQGSIAGLAGKLGELQGRVLAMESVRARVAQAAGLDYTAPELVTDSSVVASGPASSGALADDVSVMDDIPAQSLSAPAIGSAELLGRHIDALGRRLETQEDAYALVDAALSRQAGFQASLPTLSPVDYPALSSSFGWRRNPVSGRYTMHEGLDFVAPRGAPIRAASGGLVTRAGSWHGYGRMVEIDHGNGLRTRYAHASSLLVKTGDIVRQGQLIARVGSTGRSTGAHLHFEVRMADYPLDPSLFIQEGTRTRLALGPSGQAGHSAGTSVLR